MRWMSILVTAAFLAVSCATTDDVPSRRTAVESSLPQWVIAPDSVAGFEETFAATGCVLATGNFSADRTAAAASAMAELARAANTRVASSVRSLVESSAEDMRAVDGDGRTRGAARSSNNRRTVEVTELFTAQNLTGSRTHTIDYVVIDGARNLCAMVYLDEDSKAELVARVEDELARQGAFFDEDVLFEALFQQEERERLERVGAAS